VLTTSDPTQSPSAWSATAIDPHQALSAVSCASSGPYVAVDARGHAFVSPTPGASTWSTVSVDASALTRMSRPTASLCVAVDEAGNALATESPGSGRATVAPIDPGHRLRALPPNARPADANRCWGACARLACGAALFLALLLTLSAGAVARRASATPIPVSVIYDATNPGAPVPRDFLGLSFEMSSLPQIARYSESGDLTTLLRSLGPGGVLRFGGVSADTRVAWTDDATARPSWASRVLEASDLRRLAALSASSGWPVLFTVGLIHYEPQTAAREAAAAKAALGSSLEGIELGNEPNGYALHGFRPEPWSFVQYDAEVAAYRAAIESAAPGIPLAGPDVSGSGAFESWGPAEVVNQRPALLTGHHYPLGCAELPGPSIARLLSPLVRRRERSSLRRFTSVALAGETSFRLDETNTVSCGGVAGISNTFASALWAVGYLTQAMGMGVEGVNLHGNPANCDGYTPLCAPTAQALASGALIAQPEWYALLLLKRLTGDRPLPTTTSSRGRPDLAATVLMAGDGTLHFVLVDDDPLGARPLVVRLPVGRGSPGGSILTLSAPSPAAVAGVRLGGRAVSPDGSWTMPARPPRAANKGGMLSIRLRASSAVLVTVPPPRSRRP
jgi:hypothetical protein